jgi:hypothetical protein
MDRAFTLEELSFLCFTFQYVQAYEAPYLEASFKSVHLIEERIL